MDKQIPIYFDNVIIASPIEQISEANPNLGRLRVGVFTKYGNRNGSYIKDNVADMLIKSATRGDTPVVGFFDPESKNWAGHTGPTLANAYGYVEGFEGWQPFKDNDGVEREYAVFSVVLFTRYFEEAKLIQGQNQSMELDINSIDGSWADIEGNEYFVYTTAKIQGLCIIGQHQPCFSVSHFFAKKDDEYKDQFEKFSSLLAAAKAQVEEADRGGEPTMDEFEKIEETVAEEESTPEQVTQEPETEFAAAEEVQTEETVQAEEEVPAEEVAEEVSSELQQQFEALQNSYNELSANYEAAQNRINEVTAELEALRANNEELQASITTYEVQMAQVVNEKKNSLLEKYEKVIDEGVITELRQQINNYSYDELESKLAITFANQQMAGAESEKVPLQEPAESQFALLMKKYRKN